MKLSYFVPNAGRMPVLDCLPTLIQQPIAELEKLPCVAGVISGKQQGYTTTLLIDFKADTNMQLNYKAALNCFAHPGLSIKALSYSTDFHIMKIKLSHSKVLLN